MAFVTRPSLWRGSPPSNADRLKIDWAHPLANGMTDCLVWNQGLTPANLAYPSAITTLTGAPTFIDTEIGISGYATGGSYFAIPDHGNAVAGDFSVRVLFRPVTWPGNFTTLFAKSTGGPRELGIFVSTGGDVDFTVIGTGSDASVYSTGMTAGGIWDFIITRSGTTVTYYVNGVSKGAGTSGSFAASPGPLKFGFDDAGGGVNPDIQYFTTQLWTRCIEPAEVAQLYNDPYCFTVPAEATMPALFIPATPGVAVAGGGATFMMMGVG